LSVLSPLELRNVRHLIITGGTGYIGACVVEAALASGTSVALLGRSPAPIRPGLRHVPWALGDDLPLEAVDPQIPIARQALIHLAHDWRNSAAAGEDEGGLNSAGTRRILAACRERRVGRFVFASSQSARSDAANIYGRVKWKIEQQVDRPNETSARIGLVYGGRLRAMYGLLVRLAGLAPFLPMVEPSRKVQPIHVREVARALLLMADGAATGWLGLAAPEGVTFGRFLKVLAAELHGRRLAVIPIPLRLALLACATIAAIPLIPTIDRERVLGLAGTRPLSCAEHLRTLGLVVEPFVTRLRREPLSRKAMLAEGYALLRYVLRARPSRTLLRRYARAVRATDAGGPLALPFFVHVWPALIRLTEPLPGNAPLARRLSLATALVEASPQGERALGHGSRGRRIAGLGISLVADGLSLPFRLIAGWFRR
jgi:nucleoside-diphosphate-sugar epimerase